MKHYILCDSWKIYLLIRFQKELGNILFGHVTNEKKKNEPSQVPLLQ